MILYLKLARILDYSPTTLVFLLSSITLRHPLASLTLTLRKYRNEQQPGLYLLTLHKMKQCRFSQIKQTSPSTYFHAKTPDNRSRLTQTPRPVPLERLHKHINYITEKAWTRINIMRCLKFKLDRKSLEQIYLIFIRPLLEYGDIIWDNCLRSEKQKLEQIRIEAARIATGATKLVSIAALYRETRWDSLDEREGHIN